MVTGISVIENIPIPYSLYVASKVCGMEWCPIEAMGALNVVNKRVTSEDWFATYLTVELSVSPFSDEGIEWLEQSRGSIQQLTNNNNTTQNHPLQGIEVYIEGSAAIAHDAVHSRPSENGIAFLVKRLYLEILDMRHFVDFF